MKYSFFILLSLIMFNCSEDDTLDLTVFNLELSVLENLENGVPVLDISNELGVESLYGVAYGGGFIFNVDQTDGSLMVAADYSDLGPSAWGDHFDLTNGILIGNGLENTQQIVDGNLNDNSSVPNGLEFGSDDYVFKIVIDLEYRNYDDWFVPSSDSMRAIFDNVHSQGLGDFDETLFYWTSTKDGYQPFVMSFSSTFSGEPFLGSCFNSNGVLIVRKF